MNKLKAKTDFDALTEGNSFFPLNLNTRHCLVLGL